MPKSVLFLRDFRGFTGGNLKVADYIGHVRSNPAYRPILSLSSRSLPSDLWDDCDIVGPDFDPELSDVLVLAGRDWEAVPKDIEMRVPVINLIQGLRHADGDDVRYGFLGRRATRLCVSAQVADAILATGQCNGPVHVVPAALRADEFSPDASRSTDVFIAGLKAPELALAVMEALTREGLKVIVATQPLPRADFLEKLHDARIAVTLPFAREGFFLPALEAMAAGCLVICPDAVGNRDICIDGETCLMPLARQSDLVGSVMSLVADRAVARRLTDGAMLMVRKHNQAAERRSFMNVLNATSPRNIILTGLPRSGTTLACSLLGQLPEVVALHEPMKPMQISDLSGSEFIDRVVAFFDAMRQQIKTQGTAVSKSQAGRVPRNPLGDEVIDGERVKTIDGTIISVGNVTTPRFDLCMKHPAMFTARLPVLAEVFDCYAIVRNPLSVLLSWSDSGMAHGNGHSPAAESHDGDLAALLRTFPDVLDRQIALLDYMFARYRDVLPDRTIRYEDVISTGGAALSAIVPAAHSLKEELSSRNHRLVAKNPHTLRIAHRLLENATACWFFYDRSDVLSMVGR
jgi:glycosyltransferase involved in cell wall biosynthesis